MYRLGPWTYLDYGEYGTERNTQHENEEKYAMKYSESEGIKYG